MLHERRVNLSIREEEKCELDQMRVLDEKVE
jgi:hypothetical protein